VETEKSRLPKHRFWTIALSYFLEILTDVNGSMGVTVACTRMMQVARNKIIDMISMGDCFVTAAMSMFMFRSMIATFVIWRASSFVCCFRNFVLINMIVVHVVQMSIVKIVNVPIMFYCFVSTIWSVFMGVFFVSGTARHMVFSSL
jgi:hypothetical protein